jgi:hypothetical protein
MKRETLVMCKQNKFSIKRNTKIAAMFIILYFLSYYEK